MSRGKTTPDSLRRSTSLLAAVGLAGGLAAFAGEKVQLSNPDKGPVLPPKVVNQPGRDKAPFDFFDSGNSVGGVVDAPSATPSAGPGDPRAQRKLIEMLEKQKSWATQDGKSSNGRTDESGKDADASEANWENFEESALSDDFSGRNRRSGELDLNDSPRSDDSQGDRRRSDRESTRRDQARRRDFTGDHNAREASKANSSTDDASRESSNGGTPGFGERVQFSDPFGASAKANAGGAIHSPFDVGSDRYATTVSSSDPAAAADVRERKQQFQQLLGGDGPKTGLDGLGLSRTPAERNAEFRALLNGGSGASGAGGFTSPLESTKPAAAVLAPPKSSLPASLFPASSAGGGFPLPAAALPAPPAATKAQPAILPFPKRTF